MKTVDDWTPDSSMFEIRLFKKQKKGRQGEGECERKRKRDANKNGKKSRKKEKRKAREKWGERVAKQNDCNAISLIGGSERLRHGTISKR